MSFETKNSTFGQYYKDHNEQKATIGSIIMGGVLCGLFLGALWIPAILLKFDEIFTK